MIYFSPIPSIKIVWKIQRQDPFAYKSEKKNENTIVATIFDSYTPHMTIIYEFEVQPVNFFQYDILFFGTIDQDGLGNEKNDPFVFK